MRNRVFTAARDAISPNNAPRDSSVFHVNSTTVWLCVCRISLTVLLPLLAVGACISYFRGDSLAWCARMLIFTAAVMAAQGLLYFALEALFFVRIGDTGIVGTDFWGRKLTFSWAEIETVKPTHVFGVPYLKVHSFRKGRGMMWFPLFLRKPDDFRAAVAYHASPNNPLRRYLEDEHEPERERLRG